jgi:hypothetical protein
VTTPALLSPFRDLPFPFALFLFLLLLLFSFMPLLFASLPYFVGIGWADTVPVGYVATIEIITPHGNDRTLAPQCDSVLQK